MPENTVLQDVLNSLHELNEKVSELALSQARSEVRYAHLSEEGKAKEAKLDELVAVLNQGKVAAKVLAVLVAIIAGLGTTWDWIVAHIRIM